MATVKDAMVALRSTGLPVTHLVWPNRKAPALPYLVLVPHESRYALADNGIRVERMSYDVELYARERSMADEASVRDALLGIGLVPRKSVSVDEENQYIVTYFGVTLTE